MEQVGVFPPPSCCSGWGWAQALYCVRLCACVWVCGRGRGRGFGECVCVPVSVSVCECVCALTTVFFWGGVLCERERDVWSSIGLRDHLHGL